ncbi:pilus assembly protein PilP, partial [Kaarinaea lacus]
MKQLLTQTLRERISRSSQPDRASLFKIAGQCLLMVPLAIVLVACGGTQDQDLRNYVKEVKARKKGNIPPLPEPQKFEIFTYDESSVRDPFVPTQVIEAAANAGSGPHPEVGRVKDVLEEFALGSLKMMGSLERDGKRWALMKA